MKSPRESDWLSTPGQYQDLVSQLCAADPRLRSRCVKNTRQRTPWPSPSSKLVVLEAGSDSLFGTPIEHNPPSLKTYLETQAVSPTAGSLRRVFILEGLHPDFIAVLGAHFKMHPSLFVEHERAIVISEYAMQENDALIIPATAKQHCTLRYFELLALPHNAQGVFKMSCAVTGRHIGVTRIKGNFSEVGIVRRKCSIWRQASRSGHGWDCIIITDPPLRTVKVSQRHAWSHGGVIPVSPGLFQNGYPDFMPHSVQMATLTGPPRTSMLDDLCFYLRQHSARLRSGLDSGPDSVALFAKKIVAAHYLQLWVFTRSVVSTVQFQMSRQDRIEVDHFDSEFVEAQWSDQQALERRMSEYCEDIETVMVQCGIPLEDRPDTASFAAMPVSHAATAPGHALLDDCAADYQVLRLRLQDVRHRAELLNTAITSLASMSGNRQALREAKSTKALTFVGLVFIPLAYTASLLSMTDPYGPGRGQFWLYFAISLPLILCVLGIYLLMDRVYNSSEFSVRGLRTFLRFRT